MYSTLDRAMAPRLLALLAVLALVLAACGGTAGPPQEPEGLVDIEVHRTPDCSCCVAYENYLMAQGFFVRTTVHPDLAAFREDVGVPPMLTSCHTAVVGGYFVEGHVPADAIRYLLDEAPDLDGIALPGMPPGSPGMGGTLTGPLVIYGVSGDEVWVLDRD